MKTIKVNEQELVINGIKAKQLGTIMNHYAQLRKRAAEDENVSMALSGLMYLFNESKKEKGILNMMIPQVIATFYDELLALLKELTGLTQEVIDDMELTTLVELVYAYVEETNFEQLIKMLGKFSTQFKAITR